MDAEIEKRTYRFWEIGRGGGKSMLTTFILEIATQIVRVVKSAEVKNKLFCHRYLGGNGY
jgi:hypothetical protein